jgi:protein ImuB
MLDTERPRRRSVEATALFQDPSARPDRTLLLEKLATLPGLSCHTPREEDEPLPEASEKACSPIDAVKNGAPADVPFSQSPLWLLEPPRPLDFRDGNPEWMNAPLEWLPGEERFSSHWWQPDNHVREYRIARHPTGVCCWVFRERRSGRWYLQGLF